MARRRSKRPYGQGHIPLSMDRLASVPRTQTGPGGADFTVRHLRGGDKPYSCPGCHRVIPAGTAHVVATSLAHVMLGAPPLVEPDADARQRG